MATTTDLIRRVTWENLKKTKKMNADFRTGDTVGVYVKVKEGEKERIQLFTGVVIKVQGSGVSRSFTVRKIASGVGVERTFPVASPIIDKIEILSRGKVRRSRLFFLRGLKGRSARLDSEAYYSGAEAPGAADEIVVETPAAAGATSPVEAKSEPKAEKKAEPKAEKAPKSEKPEKK